jgi:hypothetical protein
LLLKEPFVLIHHLKTTKLFSYENNSNNNIPTIIKNIKIKKINIIKNAQKRKEKRKILP